MGYNWRDTLGDYAQVSGVLAGFCFALIVFVLGWKLDDTPLYKTITYGKLSIILIGISFGLELAATQLFLDAKNHNIWNVPAEYKGYLMTRNKIDEKGWSDGRNLIDEYCKKSETLGRNCYNAAILLLLVGLAFVVAPYSPKVSLIILIVGGTLEGFQFFYARRLEQQLFH